MPKLLVLAACSLVPLTAFADDAATTADDAPTTVAEDVQPAEDPPPTTAPIAAPGMTEPTPPPAETRPCAYGWYRHAGPRRGFIGIGFAKGHIGLDDDTDGRQKALIVRAQGRRGFGIELELARAHFGDDRAKTGGGALYKAFGRRHLMPYILVGAGRGTIDRASGAEDHMRYAEWGGGLMLKGRRLAIGVDVRKGVRRVDAQTTVMPTFPGAPAVVMPTDNDDRDGYVRGRVMALLTF